ncbi:MAG: o-succinylbenzoate--CoA ligase [Firmicutes bacterium]|nr:o-succinylbenzoate--CoA ligase [Alicyclobacillaceae bacterium]MCL6496755.1 o-succinylbenzoate--CoA ligase [Bacillota bacterium]
MQWDWIRVQAERTPDLVAIEVGGCRWTYADFDARVGRAAGWLTDQAVRPHDRVAVHLPPGIRWVELLFAAVRLRATVVPLNLRWTAAELGRVLRDVEPAAVITDSQGAQKVAAAWKGPTAVVADDGAPFPSTASLAAADPPDGQDLQSILYTSGTTGVPKGATIRLEQHFWAALGSMLRLGHLPDDAWLLCMPLFHVGGQAILFRAALAGTRVVIHPRFDARAVAEALTDGSVTLVSLVPTMLRRVLEVLPGPVSPRLRAVLLGGGPAPPDWVRAARARGLPIRLTYGLTETCAQVATEGGEVEAPDGAVGRPLAFAEVAITAWEGPFRPLPPGAVGEIVVRGPQVTTGYWKGAAPGRFSPDGWFYTGDIGWMDAAGWLHVLDRRLDLIISGGENVYPAEVEAAIMAHPAVEAAAVVPKPDPEWGQVPVAFVVRRSGWAVGDTELIRFLEHRLAGYKVPRRIWFVEQLPMTGSGKVARHRLRAWAERGREP